MAEDNKIFEDVIAEALSTEHLKVVNALKKPKRDLDLATELGLEDTAVRVILNDLHERKLVRYKRTKNHETGWVTHHWVKREDQLANFSRWYLKSQINKINKYLNYEVNSIRFRCGCNVVSYDDAMSTGFICPACEKNYEEYNNTADVEEKVCELTRLSSLLNQT
ncbi:MAG: hypothetical protein GF334_02175 [Candidatus Altiarchaeales archaeon]|nr:hypothetical protein [Candidatus Altiarchaeales archaeon]